MFSSSISMSKSQKSRNIGDIQYFKDIIKKVGITLKSDESNIYDKESFLIIRDLKRELETHENYPHNIPEFMKGLKYMSSTSKKETYLKNALSPSVSTTGKKQDCLIRIFLLVECLQDEITKLLLQEVIPHVIENDETNWLRLFMSPLRFLSFIKDPKSLAGSILELLESGTHAAQLELLTYIPEILPDSEYENSAREISKLLTVSPGLVPAVIDCLDCLGLSAQLKEEVQDHLLLIMDRSSSLSDFPMIIQFLVADCRSVNLINILTRTRMSINNVITKESAKSDDEESNQVITFQQLRKLTVGPMGKVADGWIQVISSIKTAAEHRPIDLLILFMLHSVKLGREKVIETLIKKKIKLRHFKVDFVENTIKNYLPAQIYNEYLRSIETIASHLVFTQGDANYIEIAHAMYRTAFMHKHADVPSRKEILEYIMRWPSNGASNALKLLQEFSTLDPKLLAPHILNLFSLLDKLEMVTLSESAQIFDFLCSIIWTKTDKREIPDQFQNEMHMIIRKQLHNTKKSIKYRGIVAVTSAIKHIANSNNDESINADLNISSINDLPSGQIKMAGELLKMALDSNLRYPLAKGLYYDQLAQAVVNCENMDRYFVAWLTENVTTDFQTAYIVSELPEKNGDISFEVMYDLNEKDSVVENIIINIGALGLEGSIEKTNTLITLSPLFRLVRLLHQRQYNDSLDNIDALLGCGVSFPQIDPDHGLESYGIEDSRKIINCLFYTINWFRELISAFVRQKGNSVRIKVLKRITNLITLEEKMKEFCKTVSDHKFPISHFYNVDANVTTHESDKKVTKTNKKVNLNASRISTQGASTQTQIKTTKKTQKDIPRQYRELDTDIILLLKLPLNDEQNDQLNLTIPQFIFIMQDLVTKLQIFSSNNANLSHLMSTSSPDLLFNDCLKLLPFINGHLNHIENNIKELLNKCDNIHDSQDMFTESATNLKIALSLILETIALIFSSNGLKEKLPTLRDGLKSLVKTDKTMAVGDLMLVVINRFLPILDCCLTLNAAVATINIIKAFCGANVNNVNELKVKLRWFSGKFLERKWFNLDGLIESGSMANVALDKLILAHLDGSEISEVRNIVDCLHEEVPKLCNKDDFLTTFNCINKMNFALFYRAVCAALLDALNVELKKGKTNERHVEMWYDIVTTLHKLMNIVKIQENRSNLKAFLKRTTGILKLFLSNGLPIFEITLKTNAERVIEIMKIMQQSTRFVQNLCCHSKISKDLGLVSHIPQMRLTLETLVYRVKALLAANNCSSAFWMGNLKNKNLRGEEISSQLMQSTVKDNDSDNDENLPPENSENESENDTSFSDEAPKSLSEIF